VITLQVNNTISHPYNINLFCNYFSEITMSTMSGTDAFGRYDGTPKYFFAYKEDLIKKLKNEGLQWILGNDILHEPLAPPAATLQAYIANPNLLSNADHQVMSAYHNAMTKFTVRVDRAHAIFETSLGETPLALIDTIQHDPVLTTRQKIQNSIAHMEQIYGANGEATRGSITDDMDLLPVATTPQGGLYVISSLMRLNRILANMGGALTSAQMRTRLFNKLHGPLYQNVIDKIDSDQLLTFELACQEVQRVINLHRSRTRSDLSAAETPLNALGSVAFQSHYPGAGIAASLPAYLYGLPAPVGAAPVQAHIAVAASAPPVTVTAPPTHTAVATIAAVTEMGPKCFNCNGSHLARDCAEPLCNHCGSTWTSTRALGYHHFNDCPHRADQRNVRQRYTSYTRPNEYRPNDYRGGRSRGGGRGRGRGRGNGYSSGNRTRRAGINSLGASTALAEPFAAFTEDDWEDYAGANALPEEDYDGSRNDDYNDDYINAAFNMMSMSAPSDSSLVADESHPPPPNDVTEAFKVLPDSGANICATPPITAIALDRPIHKWQVPYKVVFGNGTVAFSYHYVHLGPIFGKTALLNGCANTILSVPSVNQRGYDVMFGADRICRIWDADGKKVVHQPLDKDSRLYYADLLTLLRDDQKTDRNTI
jgi:hypothetical protein